jgi:hypothetical protein
MAVLVLYSWLLSSSDKVKTKHRMFLIMLRYYVEINGYERKTTKCDWLNVIQLIWHQRKDHWVILLWQVLCCNSLIDFMWFNWIDIKKKEHRVIILWQVSCSNILLLGRNKKNEWLCSCYGIVLLFLFTRKETDLKLVVC